MKVIYIVRECDLGNTVEKRRVADDFKIREGQYSVFATFEEARREAQKRTQADIDELRHLWVELDSMQESEAEDTTWEVDL